jgi:hypothetical protein
MKLAHALILLLQGLMTESEVEEKISFNRLMHRQSKVPHRPDCLIMRE